MDCFRGRLLAWHLAAMGLTWVLVASGFDWRWFVATRDPTLRAWMFPSAPIGGLVPILLPLLLLAIGAADAKVQLTRTGWTIGQAELVGSLISSAYKAVTGRAHPWRDVNTDISQVFHFGLLRGGVFWGWPSSHTTIAFAMAVVLFRLHPKPRWLGYVALAYAGYIGIGVSTTIHWFSDFVAGAILGTVIGTVVSKNPAPANDL
jgi:membrane-associated phospholipid phosphatase